MRYNIRELMEYTSTVSKEVNGEWLPCRSLNHEFESFFSKLRNAVDVLLGKCDVVYWDIE